MGTGNDLNAVQESFRVAARERGVILPAHIEADGAIHASGTEGKERGKDGRYLLHLDGIPAGGFQNFRDGLGWQDWRMDAGRRMSPAELADCRRRAAQERERRERAEAEKCGQAADRARRIWESARSAPADHPYLVRKGVRPYGLRADRAGRLIVPVMDSGWLFQSLQFIGADGKKKFLAGGRVRGGRFLVGDIRTADLICVAEGYATAATVHAETGYPVVLAFDCGNMEAVAVSLRARYPKARLVICADNDHVTEANTGRNPGVEAARKAASAVGGAVAHPPAREGVTDWNDYALKGGRHVGRN